MVFIAGLGDGEGSACTIAGLKNKTKHQVTRAVGPFPEKEWLNGFDPVLRKKRFQIWDLLCWSGRVQSECFVSRPLHLRHQKLALYREGPERTSLLTHWSLCALRFSLLEMGASLGHLLLHLNLMKSLWCDGYETHRSNLGPFRFTCIRYAWPNDPIQLPRYIIDSYSSWLGPWLEQKVPHWLCHPSFSSTHRSSQSGCVSPLT